MANIELKYFDGSTYQVLYPSTIASQVSGTFTTSQIPNLATSKITSGTFDAARIPSLPASKLTSGVFGGNKGEEYIFPGNLRVGGTGSNSDAYIRIGDGDYVHFHEDSDDNLTIKAKRINFLTTSTPGLTNNGNALGGGNSQVLTYTGTGTSTHTRTFNFSPKFFCGYETRDAYSVIWVNGEKESNCCYVNSMFDSTASASSSKLTDVRAYARITLNGNSLSIEGRLINYSGTNDTFAQARAALNYNTATYHVLALG